MYLEGCTYLSGRRGKSQLVFKNTLEKGLTGGLQVLYLEGRFSSAVKRFLKSFTGEDFSAWNVEAFSPYDVDGSLPLIRPWLVDCKQKFPSVFVLPNPFPWCEAPVPVVSASLSGEDVKPYRRISPAFLAASARAFDDLIQIEKIYREADFARFDDIIPGGIFERKGPYLYYSDEYKGDIRELSSKALDFNLLISDSKNIPLFIPPVERCTEFVKFCRYLNNC